MKTCTNKNCENINPQPDSNFHEAKHHKDGLTSQCKNCASRETRKRFKENPGRLKATRAKYYAENKGWLKDHSKNFRMKKIYGITLEQYNQMFVDQQGCCAICSRPQTEFKKNLAVDHNHETGKTRQLLCHYCNFILGASNESCERLKEAIRYLEKWNQGKK